MRDLQEYRDVKTELTLLARATSLITFIHLFERCFSLEVSFVFVFVVIFSVFLSGLRRNVCGWMKLFSVFKTFYRCRLRDPNP